LGKISDIDQLYINSDLIIHPTKREGFGLIVLESMLNGVPIVASDKGSMTEIIENDISGNTLPLSDISAWVSKISILINRPDILASYVVKGKALINIKFSIETSFNKICDLYEKVY
jgi:glycosyltransferase involved in cell wall biosynthesis